jgi:heptose I phosphotransferase
MSLQGWKIMGSTRSWADPAWVAAGGPSDVDTIMSQSVTDRFHTKQGRSTGRWVIPGEPGLVVYLKRHYRLSRWRTWAARWWPGRAWSPARQELENLARAADLGIPVPQPLAIGERLDPAVGLQSYLAVRELTGCRALNELLPDVARELAPLAFRRWKRLVSAELARLTQRLHGHGYFHKDWYLCHFFVHPKLQWATHADALQGQVQVIDWQRMTRHRWLAWYYRIKDLAQLAYSTLGLPITDRDRMFFLRQYAPEASRRDRHMLFRAVAFKARRYARHNQRPTDPAPRLVLSAARGNRQEPAVP